jgi:hypothetical protein
MFELVFVACLVATPHACEERSILYQGKYDPATCAMAAPAYLAAWAAEHPKFIVGAWRCQDPERRRERA